MGPRERIREIAKKIKDSTPATRYKKRPELPQYVTAIVDYLEEEHAKKRPRKRAKKK